MQSDWFVDYIRNTLKQEVPNVFVETGTFHAGNIPSKIGNFKEIHSIDLNPEFVQGAREKIRDPSVTFHHGDSADVLEQLASTWQEPVVFYLDAHWSGGATAFGRDETPLLRELRVLAQRPFNDIVFVDDMRLLGKKGQSGTPGDTVWPVIEYDWVDVSEQAIIATYRPGYKLIHTGMMDRGVLVPV